MTLITVERLRAFAPKCNAAVLAPALAENAERCEINTPRLVRHFMAHLHVESQGLTRLEENLNYITPGRLMAVWPRRFPTLESERPYLRNPQALAEKVYGNRMGNTAPGMAYDMRGSGLIMLTGFDNFKRAEAWTGLPLTKEPWLARQPATAAKIACDFWRHEGLNAIVAEDPGEDAVAAKIADATRRLLAVEGDDLSQGTQEINGGQIGAAERLAQLVRASKIPGWGA